MTRKKTKAELEVDRECERIFDCISGVKFKRLMRPRPITAQERAWLVRGLRILATGQYVGCHVLNLTTRSYPPPGPPIDPRPYLDQLDRLRVVSRCRCGQNNCHKVGFEQSAKAVTRAGRVRGEDRRDATKQTKSRGLAALVHYHTGDGRYLIITVDPDTKELAELVINLGGCHE